MKPKSGFIEYHNLHYISLAFHLHGITLKATDDVLVYAAFVNAYGFTYDSSVLECLTP